MLEIPVESAVSSVGPFPIWHPPSLGMRVLASAVFFTVTSSLPAFCQAPARLEFEVASVKPAKSQPAVQANMGVHIDGAQVHISYYSLRDYIRRAYRLRNYQISGPDWLASERFDVDAKLPEGGTPGQVPEMLQALLADRFQLTTHRGSKELPAYGLLAVPGALKLKQVGADAATDSGDPAKNTTNVSAGGSEQGVSVNYGNGTYYTFANNRLEVKKFSMARFADLMSLYLDRPVVDMTDRQGDYDFTLGLTPEDYRVMLIRIAMSQGVALPPEALRLLEGASDSSAHAGLRALGLKLEPRKAPIQTLVVDHILKSPTEN
jgi:uncharacterized protein (TIGR03435 family)